MVSIIVAVGNKGAIGLKNQLLWHISADLKHFKAITTGHAVIMGRKTFESIGKPLPNRQNIVISHNPINHQGVLHASSLAEALQMVQSDEAFVIGGGEIYGQALHLVDRIYLTRVWKDYEADTFFPEIGMDKWSEISREDFPAEGDNPAFSFILLESRKQQ